MVTVAGSGVAYEKAVAPIFARQGAVVHVLNLKAQQAEQTVAEIREVGGEAHVQQCDEIKQ
ncbi:hypothetical protein [Pontibacter beigongshangensis]|uniref:hypothetical protein n=1 Tax=Pontibacter beigongshangensis TaxID=2574733 RepID=UPI00164F543D|nr:hypothetical protein [Pontibacter beigongshangensis]